MSLVKIPDSERLAFDLMDDADADLMWQLDQDEEVMRFINGGKTTSREELDDVLLPRLSSYRNPEMGWGLWKVLRKDDDVFLGWILVRPMHFFDAKRDDSDLEVGWRFHREHWGHGYATEAARAVMDAISVQANIGRFSAIAVKENAASINIMKKLGMSFVKHALHEDPLGDMVVDYYSIDSYPA